MIIAQGKAAEAAALGCDHPIPSLPFFPVWRAVPAGAANRGKGEGFIPVGFDTPKLASALLHRRHGSTF
jgi:hypothetical protein